MSDTFAFDLRELDMLAKDMANLKFDIQNSGLWKRIALLLYEIQGKIFKNEGAYGGHAKWADSKKKKKNPNLKTLVKTGAMRRAVGVMSTEDNYLIFGISGSVIPYAASHQWGWSPIPPREFIFVTPQDIKIFGDVASEWYYKKIVKGIRGSL